MKFLTHKKDTTTKLVGICKKIWIAQWTKVWLNSTVKCKQYFWIQTERKTKRLTKHKQKVYQSPTYECTFSRKLYFFLFFSRQPSKGICMRVQRCFSFFSLCFILSITKQWKKTPRLNRIESNESFEMYVWLYFFSLIVLWNERWWSHCQSNWWLNRFEIRAKVS